MEVYGGWIPCLCKLANGEADMMVYVTKGQSLICVRNLKRCVEDLQQLVAARRGTCKV